MLTLEFTKNLEGRKNLLGFSGGVDSVGLFHALRARGIGFDIAIVDYGVRMSAKDEVAYAQALADEHKKQCFIYHAPKILKNFEAKARAIRYGFFEEIIASKGYANLILAHHLNDRFEWLLMQLSKGSSLGTLLGFDGIEDRRGYQIIRPLINVPKSLIYEYCNAYEFYEDTTNTDTSYKRNAFRQKYANEFIKEYSAGVRRSFQYLSEEKSLLYPKTALMQLGSIYYFAHNGDNNDTLSLYRVDKILKQMGYVLSAPQRQEILKSRFSLEIAQQYTITKGKKHIFIARNCKHLSLCLPKRFKNIARSLYLPPKIRPFVYGVLLEMGLGIDAMAEYLRAKDL
ncbi:tRNA lysidine(34) synthetase TilS [Helicobacter sp. 12S02634-8]|uniref:tRNA lysidine(34) synthetase TilS n=1 Tax=Helicobacter sp. 12S02634-8 TaxID=1476199 RepID=UPI000BA7BEA4|nr:tRNA lysidine(34) synthetase TilS [Helicobacter sp. 12S02634-8]PAF46375.1 tRNA lysidine(34) synthetase TilS [Helicobacter sp. 12S02634-8]